jgi:hypothetical protein
VTPSLLEAGEDPLPGSLGFETAALARLVEGNSNDMIVLPYRESELSLFSPGGRIMPS